ncbi:MAG TPA: hypothetical protein VIJ61_19820 [Thermoanaerobaculia bacterium]
MGMFDTVSCEYPLPNARHQDLEFQTKNLECALFTYIITREGRLIRRAWNRSGEKQNPDVEWLLHGDIRFYTSVKTEEPSWVEYVARFTHGRIEWIRPLEEVEKDPGIIPSPDFDASLQPYATVEMVRREEEPQPAGSEAGEGDAANPEEALLQNLRREREELERLLARCGDRWVYEDSIYRFYHQSFKVYGLQRTTQAIVQRLQALAPDRPLNPWFAQIVEAGTGKTFQPEDNARWTEVTRPILEAFFHARFFLEMAVRYADLQEPPRMLPSGYAALLYLFGLR